MSSDFSISVRNVSKQYLMFDKPEDRLKQMVIPKIDAVRRRKPREFFNRFAAVRNIDLTVNRSETVGIVGRNGSGKSTLLQMICGTLHPSSGSVEVKGRIAALLELGSGFNPEFSGKENVHLNAAVLGLSRQETDERYEDIIRFADIGQFIDHPVKTYSSGMLVRLAFAVATNVDPDILVVDEALAVGDEAFQRKCYARIHEIKEKGGTILFVSHGAQTVIQLCDRAILLDGGEKLMEGRPKSVINQYQRLLHLDGEEADIAREEIRQSYLTDEVAEDKEIVNTSARCDSSSSLTDNGFFEEGLSSSSTVSYQSSGAEISNYRILDSNHQPVNHLVPNENYKFAFEVTFAEKFEQVNFAMFVKSLQGVEIAGQHAYPFDGGETVEAGEVVEIFLPFNCTFLPGTYSCNCGVFTNQYGSQRILHRILDALLFKVLPVGVSSSRYGLIDMCPENEPAELVRVKPGEWAFSA